MDVRLKSKYPLPNVKLCLLCKPNQKKEYIHTYIIWIINSCSQEAIYNLYFVCLKYTSCCKTVILQSEGHIVFVISYSTFILLVWHWRILCVLNHILPVHKLSDVAVHFVQTRQCKLQLNIYFT